MLDQGHSSTSIFGPWTDDTIDVFMQQPFTSHKGQMSDPWFGPWSILQAERAGKQETLLLLLLLLLLQ